jgi:hypothetical protein
MYGMLEDFVICEPLLLVMAASLAHVSVTGLCGHTFEYVGLYIAFVFNVTIGRRVELGSCIAAACTVPAHIHIHTHTHTYTYIYTYIYTYTHTYIHTHIHTYIHTYTHIHTYIHRYIHTYIHIHTHTYNKNAFLRIITRHVVLLPIMEDAIKMYFLYNKCIYTYIHRYIHPASKPDLIKKHIKAFYQFTSAIVTDKLAIKPNGNCNT